MNFDSIEGLNEDEILKLYENGVVDGLENGVYTGHCVCNGTIIFGIPTFLNESWSTGTYCHLQLTDDAKCRNWCGRHGFLTYTARVYQFCTCRTYGRMHAWSDCYV